MAGFWDGSGAARSSINLAWDEVVASLSDTSLEITAYEIWTRPTVDDPWVLVLITEDANAVIDDLPIYTTFDLRIRAVTDDGVYGEFSDVITVTTDAPVADIGVPVLSDLYTDGVGSIYAVWSGYLGASPAPLSLGYVVAEISSDAGVTYTQQGTPIVAAGAIVVNPGTWGDYKVRLRAYDKLGNAGTASAAQDISLVDPHVAPAIPNAPENLVATAGAGWDATGFFPTAWFDLTWDDVDEDTDSNPINVVGFDVYGKGDNDTDMKFLTSVPSNAARIGVVSGESWAFKVRAASEFGGISDFSDAVEVIADAVIAAPTAPDAPTLEQYAGILRVRWSGNGMAPYIKYAYAEIASSGSGPFTRAGAILNGAGDVVVTGLAPADYWAQIVLVAEDGQKVTSAISDPITLLPITGVTIQTSPLANTGIKMTDAALTVYNAAGVPTFILDAGTGEVWIAPYDAVFDLGATGTVATTGAATTGIAISSASSSFNTFIHPSGVQIRNDQIALSWWEADAADASLVNFFSPRAVIQQRLAIGDHEFKREAKTVGTRLVLRYKGA